MSTNIPKLALPPELIDKIIEHLQDDNVSLLKCSTVSRSWLPASRYHYFKKPQTISLSRWNKFDLSHGLSKPSILAHIQHIIITGRNVYTDVLDSLDSATFAVFPPFPSLKTLVLTDLTVRNLAPGNRDTTVSCFPKTVVLKLLRVHFATHPDFTLLISGFPKLQSATLTQVLFLSNHTTGEDQQVAQQPLLSYPLDRLEYLDVFSPRTQSLIFRWLLDMHPRSAITTLCFGPTVRDTANIIAFVHAVGSHLLHLQFHVYLGDPDFFRRLDLSTATNLRSLHLYGLFTETHSGPVSLNADVLHVLGGAAFPRLEEVGLGLYITRSAIALPTLLRLLDLPSLDSLLADPSRFPVLRKLQFAAKKAADSTYEERRTSQESEVLSQMPECRRLGLLGFGTY